MLKLTTKKDKQLFFAIVSAFMPEVEKGDIQKWNNFSAEIMPLLSLSKPELKSFADFYNIEDNHAYFPKYFKPVNYPINSKLNKSFIYLHDIKNIFNYLDNINEEIPSYYTLMKQEAGHLPEMIVIDWNTLPKLINEIQCETNSGSGSPTNKINKAISQWRLANEQPPVEIQDSQDDVIAYQKIKDIIDSKDPIKIKLKKVSDILIQNNEEKNPNKDEANPNSTISNTSLPASKKRGRPRKNKNLKPPVPKNIIITKKGSPFKSKAAAKAAVTIAIKKGRNDLGEIIPYAYEGENGFAIKIKP